MPDIDVDPEKLPSDWRALVRVGAFLVLLTAAVTVIAAAAAWPVARASAERVDADIRRVDAELVAHLSDTRAKVPVMQSYVEEQKRINCGIARNIYELCRLTPGARCVPMGASCP